MFEFFSKLFKRPSTNLDEYTSAGCMFYNTTLILGGYHPKKKYISGFGGKKEGNENYKETAIRELLEELFNIKKISNKALNEIYNIKPIKIQYTNKYVNLIYSFDQLTEILDILDYYKSVSSLYDSFPICMTELIFNRKIKENIEISHLCLLPNVNNSIKITSDLNNDIKLLFPSSSNNRF